MRRIILWIVSTTAALVLLFSYRTSTMGPGGADSSAVAAGTGTGAGTATVSGKTFDGSTVDTRWGPVQVRITVDAGKVVDVTALTYPTANRRDQEINDRALPVLRSEALAAQSADIDSVSGATYTSDGYKESLQAALDAADIG